MSLKLLTGSLQEISFTFCLPTNSKPGPKLDPSTPRKSRSKN